MKQFKENFKHYMEAVLPIIFVDTLEDSRVAMTIDEIADEVAPKRDVLEWSGIGYLNRSTGTRKDCTIETVLNIIINDITQATRKLLLLRDIQFHLNNHEVIVRLKRISQMIDEQKIEDFTMVIVAPLCEIPKELAPYITIMEPDVFNEEDIRKHIIETCKNNEISVPVPSLLERLVTNLRGLSVTEIDRILSLIITDDYKITVSDMDTVMDQKKQMIKKSGILELVTVKENINDIGGLENLKKWLLNKNKIFSNKGDAQKYGVSIPKGVLIAGMPGCGKSLTAKAVSATFAVPLLRMDMGRLMGKYVGESEGNMRRALRLAEATAPCILWIDEMEKAFSGTGGGGSEVTTRLFGNFLTWMQEKGDCMSFVVATANNIKDLPPELLRKGRFDEIFYVALPNEEERKKIFEIHIKKSRANDLQNININLLAKNTEGYCGADIEGVVKDGVERAFIAGKKALTTDDILNAIKDTHSLSETMKDKLEEMDKSYKDRKFKSASKE